jgi:hypothetical protein
MTGPKTCPDCGTEELHSHSFEECCANLTIQLDEMMYERDALLLRCKEAEAGWLLAATQRDDFAVSLVIARDGGK